MMLEWLQDPELTNDATLEKYEARLARRDELLDRIGNWSSATPKLDLVTQAQERHIPAAPIATSLDLAEDAQLIDRGFLVEIDHPAHGRMLFPRGALATLWDREMTPAPGLGSANAEILGELGYTKEETMLLFERSVI
jgi:formyl-CoA transferase